MKAIVRLTAVIALFVAIPFLAYGKEPLSANLPISEFTSLAKAVCTPIPGCAIPQRGTISCPGGLDALPSLMPPWCVPASQTKVRDRMLVYGIVATTDPMISGNVTVRMNMNLDSTTFSGHLWGEYTIEVPGRGSWEGMLTGRAEGPARWTYQVVLFGNGEFEGMRVRADATFIAGVGERLDGRIYDRSAE